MRKARKRCHYTLISHLPAFCLSSSSSAFFSPTSTNNKIAKWPDDVTNRVVCTDALLFIVRRHCSPTSSSDSAQLSRLTLALRRGYSMWQRTPFCFSRYRISHRILLGSDVPTIKCKGNQILYIACDPFKQQSPTVAISRENLAEKCRWGTVNFLARKIRICCKRRRSANFSFPTEAIEAPSDVFRSLQREVSRSPRTRVRFRNIPGTRIIIYTSPPFSNEMDFEYRTATKGRDSEIRFLFQSHLATNPPCAPPSRRLAKPRESCARFVRLLVAEYSGSDEEQFAGRQQM